MPWSLLELGGSNRWLILPTGYVNIGIFVVWLWHVPSVERRFGLEARSMHMERLEIFVNGQTPSNISNQLRKITAQCRNLSQALYVNNCDTSAAFE
jgi:hypothetical protein